jgi:hypothetical protein
VRALPRHTQLHAQLGYREIFPQHEPAGLSLFFCQKRGVKIEKLSQKNALLKQEIILKKRQPHHSTGALAKFEIKGLKGEAEKRFAWPFSRIKKARLKQPGIAAPWGL